MPGKTKAVLDIPELTPDLDGTYTCRVSNADGKAAVSEGVVVMTQKCKPVVRDHSAPQTVALGGRLALTADSECFCVAFWCNSLFAGVLSGVFKALSHFKLHTRTIPPCAVVGHPKPSLQWTFGTMENIIPGATGSTFELEPFERKHVGSYFCTARNDQGMLTTAPIRVKLARFAPVINSQPSSWLLRVGQEYRLRVVGESER